MSKSEDYLDQLLKGVSNEDSLAAEFDAELNNELFDTNLLEEELLGDTGTDDFLDEDFLKEFEMELAKLENVEDTFEEEPVEEEVSAEEDVSADGIESLFDDLDSILNGDSVEQEPEEIPTEETPEEETPAEEADGGFDFGFESLFSDEPLTDSIEEEAVAEEPVIEEPVVEEPEDDVEKIMAELGDIDLELDQVEAEMGITHEPENGISDDALMSLLAADTASSEDGFGETGDADIDSFAFEEPEDVPAEPKKKDKKKKEVDPNSFLGKVGLILFGEDDEEEEEEAPKPKKEKKEKPKKEKKEKPKKEKKEKPPKPKKEKKPKPPKVPDNTPPLPKKPVFLILLMVASLVALILLGTDLFGYSNQFKDAKNAYAKKNYTEAYSYVSGLEIKDKDYNTYKKYHTMALVSSEFDAYEVLMEEEFYDMALDCLIRTVGRYEKYKADAEIYGCIEELNALELKAETILSETFGVTREEALEIYGHRDRRDYSAAIQSIIKELGLVRKTEE